MQNIQIHDCSCIKRRKKEDSSSYKDHKLFLSEDRFEVVRVNCDITSIPPFRINVSLSSESIRFGTKITKIEPDDKVELGEILRLPCLPLGQDLSSRKILKVFMIYNNVNGISWTFQVVLPNFESFKASQTSFSLYLHNQQTNFHKLSCAGICGMYKSDNK